MLSGTININIQLFKVDNIDFFEMLTEDWIRPDVYFIDDDLESIVSEGLRGVYLKAAN